MQTIYFDFSRAWSQQQKDGGTIKAFQGKTQKGKKNRENTTRTWLWRKTL